MQPASYGIEQLMENDECCSSVFPIANPLQNLNYHLQIHPQQQKQQMLLQNQEQQNSVPITHQLIRQQYYPYRPPFLQQDVRLHSQIHPQSPSRQQHHQQTPFFPTKFKLGLEQNGGSSNKESALYHHHQLQQYDAPLVMQPHCWHPQEDSTSTKQPFWKQLGTSHNKHQECVNEDQEAVQGNNKNVVSFDELEAIYSLAKVAETNQAGSGSALTGENSPKIVTLSVGAAHGGNAGLIGAGNTGTGVDHGSENSIGQEASLRKNQKMMKKRKMKLSSMALFFENLVKQVMDHQEMLHRKFLEVIDKIDRERTEREETWRRQEAAKYNREAISRAHERALASRREAQIVSCIEKITGQAINLPARKTPLLLQPELSKEDNKLELTPTNTNTNTNSRWPRAEVDALIQARTSIETKFQEPGLKGPLWEEVSSLMGSMGYQRSAKRCKEKWENINKYFRKAKESTKKRSQQSNTCSYFNQLDEMYSRILINSPSSNTVSSTEIIGVEKLQGYPELLEAIDVGKDTAITSTIASRKNMKIDEMGPGI